MAYIQQYQTDLQSIVNDLETGKINGSGEALDKFRTYVTQVKNVGRYSIKDWSSNFIRLIYDFGKYFSTIDPTWFLSTIDNEISTSNFDECEILHFIKSEILWNFESHLNQENYLIKLLQSYVTNAEFTHTLGHIKMEKKEYLKAIELYSQAYRINPTETFISTRFGAEVNYIEHLIENERYNEAESLIEDRLSNNIYQSNFIRQNWIIFLKNRIKDYKLLDLKAYKKELELKKMLDSEFQSERRKVIELLGLFTAIIAFIFTTVSVAKTFDYSQAINFITCLGLVLVNFAVTISIIFHAKKIPIYKDIRLYVTIIITFFLYLILSETTLINNCLDNICTVCN